MKQLFASICLAVLSLTVAATELTPYNKATFDQSLKDGKPIAVQFHADWCPTCRRQQSSLESIYKPENLKGVTIFKADYDGETDLKKQYHVSAQSTIILFNKGKEVARTTGTTDAVELQKLIKTGLGI